MVGQRGPIWFLAGVLSGGSALRACSVPEGNSLFFPFINYVNFYSPQCPPLTGKTVKELRDYIQPFIKGIHDVSVTLDGHDIKEDFIAARDIRPVRDCIATRQCVRLSSRYLFASSRCRILRISSAAEAGAHTLDFHGESDSDFFGPTVQDVTYNLTVVPVSLK